MKSDRCLFTILVAYYKSMFVTISNFRNNVIFCIFEVCQIFKIWAPLKHNFYYIDPEIPGPYFLLLQLENARMVSRKIFVSKTALS